MQVGTKLALAQAAQVPPRGCVDPVDLLASAGLGAVPGAFRKWTGTISGVPEAGRSWAEADLAGGLPGVPGTQQSGARAGAAVPGVQHSGAGPLQSVALALDSCGLPEAALVALAGEAVAVVPTAGGRGRGPEVDGAQAGMSAQEHSLGAEPAVADVPAEQGGEAGRQGGEAGGRGGEPGGERLSVEVGAGPPAPLTSKTVVGAERGSEEGEGARAGAEMGACGTPPPAPVPQASLALRVHFNACAPVRLAHMQPHFCIHISMRIVLSEIFDAVVLAVRFSCNTWLWGSERMQHLVSRNLEGFVS